MDYKTRLKLRIESLMKKHKVTNELLSKETGISMSSINRIRMGRSNPTVDTLLAICNFFGISLQNLANSNDEELFNKTEATNVELEENNISLIKWENLSINSFFDIEPPNFIQLNNNFSPSLFAVFTPKEYGIIPKKSLLIIDTKIKPTTGDFIITKNKETLGISIVEYLQDLDKDYVCSISLSTENQEKKYYPISNFELIGVVIEFRNKLKEY